MFLNSHPTLFGATAYQVKVEGQDGIWARPVIVDGNGIKKTVQGRMGLGTGKED